MSRRGVSAARNIITYITKGDKDIAHLEEKPAIKFNPLWERLSENDRRLWIAADGEHELWSTFTTNMKALEAIGGDVEHPDYQAMSTMKDVFTLNIRSTKFDINEIAKEINELNANRTYKASTDIACKHIILSFNEEDSKKLSDREILMYGREYAKLVSDKAIALGRVHRTDTAHCHILMGSTGTDLRSIRQSKKEFAKSKEVIQRLQIAQHRSLTSLPRHGLKDQTKNISKTISQNERQLSDLKLLLENTLPAVKSTKELEDALKTAGNVSIYLRNEKLQGCMVDGKKVRFSRLGIDIKPVISRFSEHEMQQKHLQEIAALRKSCIQRDRPLLHTKLEEPIELNEKQQQAFDEIQSLREISRNTMSQEVQADNHSTPVDNNSSSQSNTEPDLDDQEDNGQNENNNTSSESPSDDDDTEEQ